MDSELVVLEETVTDYIYVSSQRFTRHKLSFRVLRYSV